MSHVQPEIKKIKLFKHNTFTDVPDPLDWNSIPDTGKDLPEMMRIFGYCMMPAIKFGFEFPDLEIFEAAILGPKYPTYPFYGFLSLNGMDHSMTLVFEHTLDILEFLRVYAPVFELLRENLIMQFDRPDL